MPRSMKDFIDARQPTVEDKIRVDVPVLLPGYSALGKFGGGDASERFSGIMATLYSIPIQPYRMIMRTINKVLRPTQPVYDQAKLRNLELVVTDTEIIYAPTSPLLLKTYKPCGRQAIADTAIAFETVEDGFSKLTIGQNLWHVHPEYAGDVRWGLRRLSDDYPDYNISFGGPELPEPTEVSADELEEAKDQGATDEDAKKDEE